MSKLDDVLNRYVWWQLIFLLWLQINVVGRHPEAYRCGSDFSTFNMCIILGVARHVVQLCLLICLCLCLCFLLACRCKRMPMSGVGTCPVPSADACALPCPYRKCLFLRISVALWNFFSVHFCVSHFPFTNQSTAVLVLWSALGSARAALFSVSSVCWKCDASPSSLPLAEGRCWP